MRSLTPISAAFALCAIALPVSIAGTNIALVLLSAALLVRARADGRRIAAAWRAEPVLACLLLYSGIGLAAALLSDSPAAAFHDVMKDLHHLWALGLFIAALELEPAAPLRAAFGLSFAAIALFSIGQSLFGERPDAMLIRAHGFVHPVVFGEQMAIATLGCACVLLRPTLKATRLAATVLMIFVATAMILSQTRMAVLSALAGFMVVSLLEPRARRWAIPALLAVATIGFFWEIIPNGGRTLQSLLSPYDPSNPQQARWALWDTALRMFRDHPVLGVGPGGYHRQFTAYFPGSLDNETSWGSAHNLYLHQLAERGALGALALLALCAALFSRAVRAARGDADTRALWAAGSIAAFLVMSLTETAFQNEQFSTLLLLVWAWGTISLRPSRENL